MIQRLHARLVAGRYWKRPAVFETNPRLVPKAGHYGTRRKYVLFGYRHANRRVPLVWDKVMRSWRRATPTAAGDVKDA